MASLISTHLDLALIIILRIMDSRKRQRDESPPRPAKRQQTLSSFFKTKTVEPAPLAVPDNVQEALEALEQLPAAAPGLPPPNDLGWFVGKEVLSDQDRLLLLTQPWRPTTRVELPFSTHKRGDRDNAKCSLTLEHMEKFKWLGVSRHPDHAGAPPVCASTPQTRPPRANRLVEAPHLLQQAHRQGWRSDLSRRERVPQDLCPPCS